MSNFNNFDMYIYFFTVKTFGDLITRMSRKCMVLFDSFSLIKLMEGSPLFNFTAISSILLFWDRKKSIFSVFLKHVVLLRTPYLKGPDSKTSKSRYTYFPIPKQKLKRLLRN